MIRGWVHRRPPHLRRQRKLTPTLTGAAPGTFTGSIAETQDDQTVVASGAEGKQGSIVETQENQTMTASGQVWFVGSIVETQDDQTATASGQEGKQGSVAETQDDQTMTASGTVANNIGSIAETQDDQTMTASGEVWFLGSLAETQDAQVSSPEFFLDLPGTSGHSASTPDHASLDITGDLDIIVHIAADDWTTVGNMRIVEKVDAYNFIKWSGSDIRLEWHDGTSFQSKTSSVTLDSVGAVNGQPLWLRATLDVDNGASDAETKFFYKVNESDPWIQLGATQLLGTTTSIRTTADDVFVGIETGGDSEHWDGKVYVVQIYDGIGGTLVADFDANDFAIGESDADTAVDSTSKTWTINGDASIILPDSGGQIGVQGTVVETTDDQTMTASGEVWFIGSVAETQADQTSAASGQEGKQGSVAETEEDDSMAASGVVDIVQGSLAETEADDTMAGAGWVEITGTVTETENADTMVASGQEGKQGSVAETEEDDSMTASGEVWFIGSLAETADDQTSAASGQEGKQGSLAETQDDQTMTASGTVTAGISGSLAETEDDDTMTASGAVGVQGSIAETADDDSMSASGEVWFIGSAAETEDDDTMAAAGTFTGLLIFTGALTETQDSHVMSAVGLTYWPPTPSGNPRVGDDGARGAYVGDVDEVASSKVGDEEGPTYVGAGDSPTRVGS